MTTFGMTALSLLLLLSLVYWGTEYSVIFAILAVPVLAFEWMRGLFSDEENK
jgi:hypothetical protein